MPPLPVGEGWGEGPGLAKGAQAFTEWRFPLTLTLSLEGEGIMWVALSEAEGPKTTVDVRGLSSIPRSLRSLGTTHCVGAIDLPVSARRRPSGPLSLWERARVRAHCVGAVDLPVARRRQPFPPPSFTEALRRRGGGMVALSEAEGPKTTVDVCGLS